MVSSWLIGILCRPILSTWFYFHTWNDYISFTHGIIIAVISLMMIVKKIKRYFFPKRQDRVGPHRPSRQRLDNWSLVKSSLCENMVKQSHGGLTFVISVGSLFITIYIFFLIETEVHFGGWWWRSKCKRITSMLFRSFLSPHCQLASRFHLRPPTVSMSSVITNLSTCFRSFPTCVSLVISHY